MNIEQASFFGLIGSGLSIAAFCGLTVVGILFVRVLDFIEGYFARVGMPWMQTGKVLSAVQYAAGNLSGSTPRILSEVAADDAASDG